MKKIIGLIALTAGISNFVSDMEKCNRSQFEEVFNK